MNAREFAVSKSTGLRKRGFGASPAASGSGVPAPSRVPSTTSRHAARTGPRRRITERAGRRARRSGPPRTSREYSSPWNPLPRNSTSRFRSISVLGQDERPIRGVRNRPQEILRQPEQRLEGARQPRRWCQCRCRCRCRCRQLGGGFSYGGFGSGGDCGGGGGRGGGGGGAAMRRCGDAAMRRCGDAAMRRCGDEERAADHRGAPAVVDARQAAHPGRAWQRRGTALRPTARPRASDDPHTRFVRLHPQRHQRPRARLRLEHRVHGTDLASMPSRRMSNRW